MNVVKFTPFFTVIQDRLHLFPTMIVAHQTLITGQDLLLIAKEKLIATATTMILKL